ncbi:MAG TPA: transglutaminase family protein [Caulobacteraceae bacterium]|nr:transglutaminase family protein [Caulobacteraceae bacterium]
MRIRVTYATSYAYQSDARHILQVLRLTPRSHEGQHVAGWQVETDADVQLKAGEDAFGNLTHILSTDRPVGGLTITVRGEVRTVDMAGTVARTTERLPAGVFLRETPLTHADAALTGLGERVAREAGDDPLSRMHALMHLLHDELAFDPRATQVTGTAAEALALGRGVCQDFSHIFIAAARSLGYPARYVSGHLVRDGGGLAQEAGHAWAEVMVPGFGWIAFDPANGICPTDAYVRVAVGLDYLGAAPIRGARTGGGEETMVVSLTVAEAQQQ